MGESGSSVWFHTMEGINEDMHVLQEDKEGKKLDETEFSEILPQKEPEPEPVSDTLASSADHTKGNSKAEEKSLNDAIRQLEILCILCASLFVINKYIILIRDKKNRQ